MPERWRPLIQRGQSSSSGSQRGPQKAASRRSKGSDRTVVNECKLTFANLFNTYSFDKVISAAGDKGISNRVAESSINRENRVKESILNYYKHYFQSQQIR